MGVTAVEKCVNFIILTGNHIFKAAAISGSIIHFSNDYLISLEIPNVIFDSII